MTSNKTIAREAAIDIHTKPEHNNTVGQITARILAAIEEAEAPLRVKLAEALLENVRLEREQEACHGTAKDELAGKPLPGNWQDGTDGACPGWWRGQDVILLPPPEGE